MRPKVLEISYVRYQSRGSAAQGLTRGKRADQASWHETQAVYSCDFQPLPIAQLKRLLSEDDEKDKEKAPGPIIAGGRQYRLATAGGDSKVRVCYIWKRLDVEADAGLDSYGSYTPTSLPLPPLRKLL